MAEKKFKKPLKYTTVESTVYNKYELFIPKKL